MGDDSGWLTGSTELETEFDVYFEDGSITDDYFKICNDEDESTIFATYELALDELWLCAESDNNNIRPSGYNYYIESHKTLAAKPDSLNGKSLAEHWAKDPDGLLAYSIRYVAGFLDYFYNIIKPDASITSPNPDSVVNGSIDIIASASGYAGQVPISKVEFYINYSKKFTDSSPPYSWSWDTTNFTNGSYDLMVKAYDAAYIEEVNTVITFEESSIITVTVNNPTGNNPPNPPTFLAQFKSDGSTGLGFGGTTDERSVVLVGDVTDPDDDAVSLEVEVKPVGTAFSNSPSSNCSSSGMVASGGTAVVACSGLADGQYHWQARAKDSFGTTSAWQSAGGGNSENDADFVVFDQPSAPDIDIVQIEYFFDTDPGFGNGTSISVTPDNVVTVQTTIDVSGLSLGLHRLYVRAKDENGQWGIVQSRPVLVQMAAPNNPLPDIVDVEYFFDEDTGLGSGSSLSLTQNDTVEISTNIDVSGLDVGLHRLYVRAKDENGNWGIVQSRPVLIQETNNDSPLPNITGTEYFFDVDPGIGDGSDFSFSPNSEVEISRNIDVSGLDVGLHRLYVRAQDENGQWGIVQSRPVLVQMAAPNNPLPDIVDVEYFFDGDTGLGSGSSLSLTQNNTVEISTNIDVSGLDVGLHRLYVRAQDENGQWGIVQSRPVLVQMAAPNNPLPDIVDVEYFFDGDPGFGNGVSFEFAPGDTVVIETRVPLDSLALGNHSLYVRAQDEDGLWGIPQFAAFSVQSKPQISVTPNSLDFGNVNLGSQSSAQNFTISNTGDTDLAIGTSLITGTDASEFSIQSNNCQGQTLAPLASCTFKVVFLPTSAGLKSANLSIPSNDPDSPIFAVPLVGEGADVVVANAGADDSLCSGSCTTLNGSATGGIPPYTYSWSPSTGLSNPNDSITNACPTATTTYALTVTDSNGCTDADTVVITVNPKPIANAGNDNTVCSGTCATLNGQATGGAGGYAYLWTPGNISDSNPTVCPTTTTIYTLTVTDDNGCTDDDQITITVNPCDTSCTVTANAGSDVSVCSGTCITLNGSASGGTPGYIYTWTPGGLTGQSTRVCPTTTTTYTLTVNDDNGCTDTDQAIVTVNVPPILSGVGDVSIQEGDTLTLSIVASDSDQDTISCSATGLPQGAVFEDCLLAWETDYTDSGSYEVTVEVSDGICSDSEMMTITVNHVNRPPVLDPIANITANEGETVIITPTVSDPDGDSLTFGYSDWMDTSTYTTDYDDAGTYTVVVTVSDGELSDSCEVTVTVIDALSTNITRPIPGDRLSGDAVIIEATTQAEEITGIDFYCKPSDGEAWTLIGTGIAQSPTYRICWNTTNLEDGSYFLKAVAKNDQGNLDQSPPEMEVMVDHQNPDYVQARIKTDEGNVVAKGDGCILTVPAGAVDTDTIVRLSTPTTIPPQDLAPAGLYIEVTLESGQTQLTEPVTISMRYDDLDNNGIVDGTDILEENLKVNLYNGNVWEELPTTVDVLNNIATATTDHFTIFGLFGSSAPNLNNVLVYPNPFKPGKGDAALKFLNLTPKATIRIYNVAGELVSIKENITAGAACWDGKNDHGKPVASGGYFYIITDDEKGIKKGKIAVIW